VSKPIAIQCLNIDCPKCGSTLTFQCRDYLYGTMTKPHTERIRAMQTLIEDSKHDWILRKILRERNFAR
jgi:hypothetical protein